MPRFRIEPQLPQHGDRLHGERVVQLDEIDIVEPPPDYDSAAVMSRKRKAARNAR